MDDNKDDNVTSITDVKSDPKPNSRRNKVSDLLMTGDMIVVEENSQSKAGAVQKQSSLANTNQLVTVTQTTISVTAQGAPSDPALLQFPPGMRFAFSNINNNEQYDEVRNTIRKAMDNPEAYAIRVVLQLVDKT